ncbi:hypothetical protein [Carboxylicivirga sp. RSCT41]|uniref:hypothetical protein n=1 Tax=Carboxylicivirga agarovorans TaxID=3417570 RepID=UPI003D3564D4
MFHLFIVAALYIGGILNTSATAIQSCEFKDGERSIECISSFISSNTLLETINAEEVEDDSNKWRLLRPCPLSDSDKYIDIQPGTYCSKEGLTSFILFESDNSPPVFA